jgi:protein SCO1/2
MDGTERDAPGVPVTRNFRMRWHRWPGVILLVLVAMLAIVVASWRGTQSSPPARLVGTVLDPPVPAGDFRLRDQEGRMVSLSGFRGRVVVLTFLYTRCPDTCPLIAERFGSTVRQLGEARRQAAFIAVSVDPAGDTPDAVKAFLAHHGADRALIYLTGSPAQLQRVWTQYHIRTEIETIGQAARTPNGRAATTATLPASFIGHTAKVYVIDPQGAVRVYLPAVFRSEDLARAVRLLSSGGVR